MKQILFVTTGAVLGGLFSLAIFTQFNPNLNNQNEIASAQTVAALNQAPTSIRSQQVSLPIGLANAAAVDFTYAAENSLNGVVHVTTSYQVPGQAYADPFHQFFFGTPQQSQPRQNRSSGSGVIISNDGFIVTNNHVIEKADDIEVVLNNNEKYKASLVGTDPSTDLALLKIDGTDLPYVGYGNSDEVKVGEWVLAVGNPFNLTSTVTAGIVSAKGRDINILDRKSKGKYAAIESFIQTDAAVNPGNSGGALVNTNGELVGINSAIQSNTGSYTGYSFAIPVNIVRKVVDDLLEFGTVQRGYIGVSIRNVNAELAKEQNLDLLSGIYVNGLTEEGAAAEAGIEPGDVIVKVGSLPVNDVPELQEQLSKFRPGDAVGVTVNRDGAEKQLVVTLRDEFGGTDLRKKEEVENLAMLGAQFESISREDKKRLELDGGVKITSINGGKLRKAGIREGFIITKVDKQEIESIKELNEALEAKNGGVLIEGIYPNGMKAYYGFGM